MEAVNFSLIDSPEAATVSFISNLHRRDNYGTLFVVFECVLRLHTLLKSLLLKS